LLAIIWSAYSPCTGLPTELKFAHCCACCWLRKQSTLHVSFTILRLMPQLTHKTNCNAGYLVVRCYCKQKEQRRQRMFEKALDAAATSPFARGVTRWLLAGFVTWLAFAVDPQPFRPCDCSTWQKQTACSHSSAECSLYIWRAYTLQPCMPVRGRVLLACPLHVIDVIINSEAVLLCSFSAYRIRKTTYG